MRRGVDPTSDPPAGQRRAPSAGGIDGIQHGRDIGGVGFLMRLLEYQGGVRAVGKGRVVGCNTGRTGGVRGGGVHWGKGERIMPEGGILPVGARSSPGTARQGYARWPGSSWQKENGGRSSDGEDPGSYRRAGVCVYAEVPRTCSQTPRDLFPPAVITPPPPTPAAPPRVPAAAASPRAPPPVSPAPPPPSTLTIRPDPPSTKPAGCLPPSISPPAAACLAAARATAMAPRALTATPDVSFHGSCSPRDAAARRAAASAPAAVAGDGCAPRGRTEGVSEGGPPAERAPAAGAGSPTGVWSPCSSPADSPSSSHSSSTQEPTPPVSLPAKPSPRATARAAASSPAADTAGAGRLGGLGGNGLGGGSWFGRKGIWHAWREDVALPGCGGGEAGGEGGVWRGPCAIW
eukprot:scaffold16437_cov64-Isochrysis_galbana.AAC.1